MFILHSLIFFRKRQDFCENVRLFRIGVILLPRLRVSRIASLFMTADAQSLTLFHFFRRAETSPASGTSLRFRSFCILFFTAGSSCSRVGRFIAEPTPPPRFRLFPVCRAVSVPLPKDLSLPATAALKSCTFFIRRPPSLRRLPLPCVLSCGSPGFSFVAVVILPAPGAWIFFLLPYKIPLTAAASLP